MVTSYDFGNRLIRLSYKSENCSRNKSDNISCDILNQTIKIIHGKTTIPMVEFTLHYTSVLFLLYGLISFIGLTMTNNIALIILIINCILSEVCMIKTAPLVTVSPQM